MAVAPAGHAMDVAGLLKIDYDFGGDKLVSATLVSSGGDSSNDAIYANSGLVLAGGISLLNEARTFALDATIGWKSDSIDASNQSFEFSRFPIDVLGFYTLPVGAQGRTRLRFGVGPTFRLSPTFDASGDLASSVKFDNAVGFIAQIDAVTGQGKSGINYGRFTAIEYQTDRVAVQGNGAGLFVGVMF